MGPVIGARAPEFELASQHGERVRLSRQVGGGAVVLVFFPLAFSPTCTSELGGLREGLDVFRGAGVEVLGISVDSTATLRAWDDAERLGFSLLADFWPHGAVAQQYGVFLADRGVAGRSTFLVGADGTIRDRFSAPPGEARPFARYLDALSRLP